MNTEKTLENFAVLRQYREKYLPQIEKSLREYLPAAPPRIEKEFNEAVEFALFSGEKRIRAVLTLLGAELLGGKAESVLPSAVAVEFIHASSKIFNDLFFSKDFENSLNNKSVRKKYGDNLSMLVALGLLNASYSLIFVNHIGMPERAMQAHAEIVECVGSSGLIDGLRVDVILNNEKELSENSAEMLNDSALIRLALRIGAILSGADYLDLANLSRFSQVFGDAFNLSENPTSPPKNFGENSSEDDLKNLIEEGKRLIIQNFPSNEARSCLIQLTESLSK